MPCEKPGIAPIDDSCCFSCYTTGRVGYNGPIAIVLHEVDEYIEEINNRHENCCDDSFDSCHQSFHYGVGDDGRIFNWVDPADTAWSFDPVVSNADCGICGWTIATQEGPTKNPNLYTINIAVTTGIIGIRPDNQNQLSNNNYTTKQYEALVRLVGWLAETYNIAVNQNNIWRHCGELNDFPSGCCDNCGSYADFLQDVQDCLDFTMSLFPELCDALCDSPLVAGNPVFIFGADAACENCGRYQLGEVMETNLCDILSAVIVDQGMPATPGMSFITSTCEAWQMPNLCQLLNATTIQTGNPITDNTIKVLGEDCLFHPIDQLANFDLCAQITATFVNDGGMAVAGDTQLLGLDCQYYTIPNFNDLCSLITAEISAYDPALNWVMLQRNQAGNICQAIVVDPSCNNTDFVNIGFGISDDTPAVGRLRPSMPNRSITSSAILDPTTDGVVYVNATNGNVTLTLSAPQGCEPNMFIIKRTDIAQGNTVTISAGGNTIDGQAAIQLSTPGPFSTSSGQSVTIYWNGVNWTAH